MSRLRERVAAWLTWRFWLTPGMGVKRHVAVAVWGALLLVLGVIGGVLWLLNGRRRELSSPLEHVLVSHAWRHGGGYLSLAVALIGVAFAIFAVGRLNRSLLSNWMPSPSQAAVLLHQRVSLAKGPRIVALGGGTGLSNLLRGLRQHTSNVTAVVTVSDDGGSSGRLRVAFDMPPPGDLTDCLAALSDNELEVSRLLQYRFARGDELKGHTFGNLLIATLTEVEGDFGQAIRVLNRLLNLSGAVYPVTSRPVTLTVTKQNGEVVKGESRTRECPGPARSVALEPAGPEAVPEVLEAVRRADLAVLGPGSLFTSTLPPIVVPGVRDALLETDAKLVYVCNIMTEAGETDGFDAFDHADALARHLGRLPDLVVLNSTPVDEPRLTAYRAEHAEEVAPALDRLEGAGVEVLRLPLLGSGLLAQHDSERLASWLAELARTHAAMRKAGLRA
ncbi:MAG TPA: uridine diphosphate-N-acetylglucosamine-binding protein YvcK [Trueperaceae bacterium]|nr:uridine diphosphate-N-acetylglucosamine-binding protein YvcK [Trueperaceae bacterium]